MHEGHRQRMYEKLASGNGLYEHEILEMLLYNAFPRKDTNPLAHELINNFGSIAGVFNASAEELKTIDGVGDSVAYYIKTAGECLKYVNDNFGGVTVLKHVSDFKAFTRLRMRGKLAERVELFCLERNGRVRRIITFSDNSVNHVDIKVDELAKKIALANPYAIVAAHNHLRGTCEPSDNDDKFTRDLQTICNINNVDLLDHCIYCSTDEVYSYFLDHKIDGIKRTYTFDNLVGQQIKKEKEEKNKNH